MKIYLLFLSLLAFTNSLLYLQREKMTKLDSENGYFFIKASDYTNPSYIYIHFKATNIMLNNLEYCDYNSVPTDDSVSKCQFVQIHPYKSKTDSNIINDYYMFQKYIKSFSFIIFHYSGVKQSDFEIKVEITDTDKEKEETKEKDESNKSKIILLVAVSVLTVALIVAIIFLVIQAREIQKIKTGQNAIKEEGNNAITNRDSFL